MLKPRFKDKAHLVAEFNSALRYLDQDSPKDPTIVPKQVASKKPVMESRQVQEKPVMLAEAAPLSRYSSPGRATDSFRVLAGLEQREMSPWNPGIVGETRTVKNLMETFQMESTQSGLKSAETHHYRHDVGGYSPKAVHHALRSSDRVLSNARMYHDYMHDLPDSARGHIKATLAKHSEHAAYKLRGAADGSPSDVHAKLHGLADRHERHAKIYASGGRPKLEAIEEMLDLVESMSLID